MTTRCAMCAREMCEALDAYHGDDPTLPHVCAPCRPKVLEFRKAGNALHSYPGHMPKAGSVHAPHFSPYVKPLLVADPALLNFPDVAPGEVQVWPDVQVSEHGSIESYPLVYNAYLGSAQDIIDKSAKDTIDKYYKELGVSNPCTCYLCK